MKRTSDYDRGMTVAELIEKLSAYPPDLNVNIIDADTAWPLNDLYVCRGGEPPNSDLETDVVYIWAEY